MTSDDIARIRSAYADIGPALDAAETAVRLHAERQTALEAAAAEEADALRASDAAVADLAVVTNAFVDGITGLLLTLDGIAETDPLPEDIVDLG